ncbi:MAG: helix-turn-helix transcriptional regulator [Clostridia bacterium]|nr:helix-turn-helix transcriptional regulator [Clostridia bacterium]
MIRLTLDEYLEKRGITRYELAKKSGIGYPIIDKYYKNAVTRYDGYVLDRICRALGCYVSDILNYSEQDKEKR